MKKIGIVGVGAIAQAHIQALDSFEGAKLVAVADVREDALAAVSETAKCQSFSSFEVMGEACELDAVIICTPPNTHPHIAAYFLARGIPVLCEKPFAMDVKSAREITDVAKETGTLVTMASKFRYVKDVIRAKSIIESGVLGDILLLENSFVSPVNMVDRWNSDPAVSGGGVWIDNGTHSVDIIRYLLGPIIEIDVVADCFHPSLKVEDNVLMTARTKSGARVRVDLSWTFDKQLPHFIRIFGSKGVMNIGWKGSQYRRSGNSDWTAFGSGYQKIPAFKANLENFCAVIDGGARQLVTVEDALASVEVVQAGYVSARDGKTVSVTQPEVSISRSGESQDSRSIS